MRWTALLAIASSVACGGEVDDVDEAKVIAELSASARRARAIAIRDVAAARGITNGALLAGIGDAETGLAHCWSEATWACQGPFSSSCNGPVIAGAGDGPCSIRQGGLGMFQFDGGNFDQTLARDGTGILILEGNIDHAVDFVLNMVVRSVYAPATDTGSALAWINSIPISPGNPAYEAWVSTVTRYYNGCGPTASCWSSRRARYKNLTTSIYNEMGGAGFWSPGPSTPPPPLTPASASCGSIGVQEFLGRGASMKSCDGRFLFVHQTDGNVVLYHGSRALWSTGTNGYLTSNLVMQHDGNLVLYASNGSALWSSRTFAFDSTLAIQDDANVVIYAPGPRPIWATHTYVAPPAPPPPPAPSGCGIASGDTVFHRDQRLTSCSGRFFLVHQGDGNVVLYDNQNGSALWSTRTNGRSTDALIMQSDGNLVLYAPGGNPLWSSRTHGNGGAFLAVQDDGNVVVYTAGGRPLWATGTNR
jgi:hypothetical protein